MEQGFKLMISALCEFCMKNIREKQEAYFSYVAYLTILVCISFEEYDNA